MSNEKSRTTKVTVHCAKKTLTSLFPDMDEKHTLTIMTKSGVVVKELDGRTESNEFIHDLAIEAGYDAYWATEEEQDEGWAVIGGRIYLISEEGPRSCSFQFKTYSKDEDEHYALLDKVFFEIEDKGVSVLRGECSITITTRC